MLPKNHEDVLWKVAKKLAKARLRRFKRGVILERGGQWGGETESVSLGSEPITISGEPGELVLLLFGRGRSASYECSGKDAEKALAKLKLDV